MGGEDRAQQTAFTAADVHDAVGCAEVVGGDDRGVLPSAARESGGTHPCRSRVRGIDGRELVACAATAAAVTAAATTVASAEATP